MICPLCDNRTKVLESRQVDAGAGTRRRRECAACGHRFTTFERCAEAIAVVRKRAGSREPFDADKLRAGLGRAAHKRPTAEAAIASIVSAIETEAHRVRELTSRRIGELCLDGLRATDRIAYLRFASVHKQLADLDAISAELSELAIGGDFSAELLEDAQDDGGEPSELNTEHARREVHA